MIRNALPILPAHGEFDLLDQHAGLRTFIRIRRAGDRPDAGEQVAGRGPSVFQILSISALSQLVLETTVWLLVSREESNRLLKLLMVISPFMVTGFVVGLPFGIQAVAFVRLTSAAGHLPTAAEFRFSRHPTDFAPPGQRLSPAQSCCHWQASCSPRALCVYSIRWPRLAVSDSRFGFCHY
jgi:hypothetical protein